MQLTTHTLKDAPSVMTAAELASALRVTVQSVSNWTIRAGNPRGWIPCERIGRLCRYPKVAVEKAIIQRYGGSPA